MTVEELINNERQKLMLLLNQKEVISQNDDGTEMCKPKVPTDIADEITAIFDALAYNYVQSNLAANAIERCILSYIENKTLPSDVDSYVKDFRVKMTEMTAPSELIEDGVDEEIDDDEKET